MGKVATNQLSKKFMLSRRKNMGQMVKNQKLTMNLRCFLLNKERRLKQQIFLYLIDWSQKQKNFLSHHSKRSLSVQASQYLIAKSLVIQRCRLSFYLFLIMQKKLKAKKKLNRFHLY